jgi:hypothetical protein
VNVTLPVRHLTCICDTAYWFDSRINPFYSDTSIHSIVTQWVLRSSLHFIVSRLNILQCLNFFLHLHDVGNRDGERPNLKEKTQHKNCRQFAGCLCPFLWQAARCHTCDRRNNYLAQRLLYVWFTLTTLWKIVFTNPVLEQISPQTEKFEINNVHSLQHIWYLTLCVFLADIFNNSGVQSVVFKPS